jgi:hypothetical protein
MHKTSNRRQTIGLLLALPLGLALAYLVVPVAADDVPRRDRAAEYRKTLAALKAALPANDTLLDRLVALHAEHVKAFAEEAEQHAKRLAESEKEKQELTAKLEAALRDAMLKVQKLEEKIPHIDLLAYDKPKGKIVAVDRDQQVAHLNIGSADFARTGLTFSVFGEGTYKPTVERKGALVIVEVTGPHACRARVTEIKNAMRRPLVAGDLLYNPAWTPGLREHVAIAGRIDLAGDGRDHTAAFIRALEKEGALVDAWLDPRDASVKGQGIVRQTSYLIIGELPDIDEARTGKLPEAELDRRLTIHQEVAKMRDDAIRLGVTTVTARRFIALIGMDIPKPDGASGKDK